VKIAVNDSFAVAAHPDHEPLWAKFWPPEKPWLGMRLDWAPIPWPRFAVPRQIEPGCIVIPWNYPTFEDAMRRPMWPRLRNLVLTVHWIWNMRRPL